MITLSNVAKETKAALKWGGIGIGAIILIWVLFGLGSTVKKVFFPTPPPPPTVGFGKIEPIEFPPQTEIKELTYTIDTLSGTLPSLPDRAKVFRTKEQEVNLLALNNAKKRLSSLGFSSQPVPIGGNVYKWTDASQIKRTIAFDIFNYNFTLSSSYLSDPNIVSGKNLPDTTEAIEKAKSFLQDLSSYPKDLDETKTKTNLFSLVNANLVPASSFSNAQLMQVIFFQKDVDKLPIYYSNSKESSMQLLLGGGSYEPQIIQAKFNHQEISDKSETYPLKTADLAFEELQKGNAYIASYQGTDKNIAVKKISLAYYIEDQRQLFLMPIFIFEGNDNFVAYLPAVTDEWLNN